MDQALNSQKTPHTSPLRASYGMSFVSILMKNDRVIKGFYCIRQTSNISRTKSQNLNVSHLVLQLFLLNQLKPGVKNEYVFGAAPTGDAPTTSDWSTMLLPIKLQFIWEIWR